LENIEDFWTDLKNVHKQSSNHSPYDHFYGLVVVYEERSNDRKYIIDGQQRTVTSMIFLRAIQYYGQALQKEPITEEQKMGLHDNDTVISGFLGWNASKYDSDSHLHLTFENDTSVNDYFQGNIIQGAPIKKKVKSESSSEKMQAAYQYFFNQLTADLESLSVDDAIRELVRYRKDLADHFIVMSIETDDLAESYVIFETLNARGQELETSDLLKNYVFSKAGDNLHSVEDKWKKITNTLTGKDLTKYIRYYWNARYSLVREKDLYREINATIKSPKDAIDLVTDLNNYAPYYHDILSPDNCIAFDNKRIIDHLISLQALGARTFIPIVLALKMRDNHFPDENIADILDAIETCVFRNATIGRKTANKIEVAFCAIANKIFDQIYQSANDIITNIRGMMISDKEFENIFSTFHTGNAFYVRYIFLKIHNFLDDNHEINRNHLEVNIEHIMPQNSSLWNIDEKTQDEYLDRLGNLTLLDGTLNKKASNASFRDKKKFYKKSLIQPNQDLLKYDEWTPREIEDRQKALTALALKIWA
jgi:hypothetical protein